ncbi:hypothetical protein [Pararhodobacter zhoushanensis]|uniref:hypothetical protein n=1 Tax=Pararhodobacter zhoushanensis TaxID=2479545 RepID=UPI000F8E8B97|nr:hypothetical protein [Pararhodobacter zhoushanensis]
MAQFKWLAPARWATPDNAFSNTEADLALLTSGGFKSFFGPCGLHSVFGRAGGGGGGSSFRITADDTPSETNEILAVFAHPFNNQTSRCFCRSPETFTQTPNGTIFVAPHSSTIVVARRSTTGAEGALETIDLAALGRNRWPITVRLRVEGTGTVSVFARAWPIGEPEPTLWDVTTTYTSTNDAGFSVIGRTGTGFPAYLSHFSTGTEGDSAPPLYGALSGIVRADDAPVSRPVVAVARGEQKYLFHGQSDGSGEFSLPALIGFDYTVFALDPLAGPYNAAVVDKVALA